MKAYSLHPELVCLLLFQHHWWLHRYNHQHPDLVFLESSKVPWEGQYWGMLRASIQDLLNQNNGKNIKYRNFYMVYTAADMILKFLNKDDCNVSNSSCTTEMFYFLWSRTWTCNELYTAASSIHWHPNKTELLGATWKAGAGLKPERWLWSVKVEVGRWGLMRGYYHCSMRHFSDLGSAWGINGWYFI